MTASPDFVVAIPARHAATRLPGKPLRLLGAEPLVLHVARRALDAGARQVWLATDDIRVAEALAGVDGVRVRDVACTSKTLPGFTALWEAVLATGSAGALPVPAPGADRVHPAPVTPRAAAGDAGTVPAATATGSVPDHAGTARVPAATRTGPDGIPA